MNIRSLVIVAASLLSLWAGERACAQDRSKTSPLRIHMIGTGEYQAAESLATFKKHLEATYRIEVTASLGKFKSLPNVDELRLAELLVLFARRMNLPDEQMAVIRAHCEMGKALVALRNGSHAFQEADNDWLGKVLGARYAGPGSYTLPFTAVNNEAQKDHPVLRGVGSIASKGPYRFGPLDKSVIVLQFVDTNKNMRPASWVHEYKGGRTFYTTMGQPEDFRDPSFRRMSWPTPMVPRF